MGSYFIQFHPHEVSILKVVLYSFTSSIAPASCAHCSFIFLRSVPAKLFPSILPNILIFCIPSLLTVLTCPAHCSVFSFIYFYVSILYLSYFFAIFKFLFHCIYLSDTSRSLSDLWFKTNDSLLEITIERTIVL